MSRKREAANTTHSAPVNTTPSALDVRLYGWQVLGLYESDGAEWINLRETMGAKQWKAIFWNTPFAARKEAMTSTVARTVSVRGYGLNWINRDTGKRMREPMPEAMACLEPLWNSANAPRDKCRTSAIHVYTSKFCTPERLRIYAGMFIEKIRPFCDTLIAAMPVQWRGARRFALEMGFSEVMRMRKGLWLADHGRYVDGVTLVRQLNQG